MTINLTLKIGLPKAGEIIDSDWQCASYIRDHNRNWLGGEDSTFRMPSFTEGDVFAFKTKGGTFEGIVTKSDLHGDYQGTAYESYQGGQTLVANGTWNGREGTLKGGMFAFGQFEAGHEPYGEFVPGIDPQAKVESSVYPKPVSYAAYSAAKQLAYATISPDVENRPELIQKSMATVLSAALEQTNIASKESATNALRNQIESFCNVPTRTATLNQELERED